MAYTQHAIQQKGITAEISSQYNGYFPASNALLNLVTVYYSNLTPNSCVASQL